MTVVVVHPGQEEHLRIDMELSGSWPVMPFGIGS
jgi:hypothetical protein